MAATLESIRNIGVVAHIDAGKTTTTERIVYYTGTSHRMGDVDKGTTTTDFDPDEARRGITIYSAAITCRWKEVTINIIDTPGHVDFTAEVERSLRVLDGAIMVFSAVEGVEAQSETVWLQAEKYHVPRICLINKMDRIGASFERTFNDLRDRLEANPVAMQIPIGAGSSPDPNALTGIIDLVEMKCLYFDRESLGKKITTAEVPDQYLESAIKWRKELLEIAADYDDEIMESYLETDDIPIDQIHRLIRIATIQGAIQPTFCGSALDYIGVQPLLDGVIHYLPSPLDRRPVEGIHPNPKKRDSVSQTRLPSPSEPFCGLVFKVQADQHTDLAFVRIYSGTLKGGSRVLNPRINKRELINQIWRVQADDRQKIETDEVLAGDIVGVIGLKESVTGDTLCDPQKPILLESIVFPETVISMAIEPETNADRKKLDETLRRLSRQDPTFVARVDEETGQTIVSGMGELHLEVLRDKMLREYNLSIRVHKPRVSYRESIREAVEVTGEFSRQQQGVSQFARVKIRVEPFDGEESLSFQSKLKPNAVPADFSELLQRAVKDEAQGGGIVGYPLMKLRFTLLDAEYRDGETTEMAAQAATADAVRKCITEERAVLLEPIMKLEIVTPDEFMGAIQADLNARRALIISSQLRGKRTVLEVEAPLRQMFGYSTQVRSLSQGRASYSMEPLRYAEAPRKVLDEILG